MMVVVVEEDARGMRSDLYQKPSDGSSIQPVNQ